MRCFEWNESFAIYLANDSIQATNDSKPSHISNGVEEIVVEVFDIALKSWSYMNKPTYGFQDVSTIILRRN